MVRILIRSTTPLWLRCNCFILTFLFFFVSFFFVLFRMSCSERLKKDCWTHILYSTWMQLNSGKIQPWMCRSWMYFFKCRAFPQALRLDNKSELSDANAGATFWSVRTRCYLIMNEPQAIKNRWSALNSIEWQSVRLPLAQGNVNFIFWLMF